MTNYLELYQSMYKVVQQETVYKRVLTIFATNGLNRHPYVTLITSEKGVKKDTPYGWSDLEKAKEYIAKRVQGYRNREAEDLRRKQERKEGAKRFLDKLKEGDILHSSWGYEAQWHDFYKVVGKQGNFVLLRELEKNRTDEGCQYGWASHGIVSPKDEFASDEILKRKADDGWVRINSYASASLWDGKAREEANWH